MEHQLLGIPLVGLDLLAILIPIPGTHHVIGHPQSRQLAVQTVTERPGLVAAIHPLGQRHLFLDPFQELSWTEPLRRLRRPSVDLPHHHVAVQMHVDAQLDILVGPLAARSVGAGSRCARGHDGIRQLFHILTASLGSLLFELSEKLGRAERLCQGCLGANLR